MRTRSILANISLAVTVGIATFLSASRFDRGKPRDGKDQGKPRLELVAETYTLKGISLARWLSILNQTFVSARNDRILSVAAGVTFYGLLALFPTIAAVLSIYGLIAESRHLGELLAIVDGALPTAGVEFLHRRMEHHQEVTLSFALIISVVLSLWSANRGIKALFEGVNVAYGETESRTFIRLNFASMNFTIGLLFFLVISIYCVVAVPLMFNFDNIGATEILLIWIGRWPVLFLVFLIGLELLYRIGPSRAGHRWAWVSPGALLASLIWLTISFLFSAFLDNFQDYDRTYGTLAAVDILLVWMWLSSICILIGAEFNGAGERTHSE